jgi:hypothetical protein
MIMALISGFNWRVGVKEGLAVAIGGALGVFLSKYIPTSGLVRAVVGFALVVLGAGFDGIVGEALLGFGVVVLVQGVMTSNLASVKL